MDYPREHDGDFHAASERNRVAADVLGKCIRGGAEYRCAAACNRRAQRVRFLIAAMGDVDYSLENAVEKLSGPSAL